MNAGRDDRRSLHPVPRIRWRGARLLVLGGLALSAACRAPVETPGADAPAAERWTILERVRPVEGERGMVVSGHPLASRTGAEILERGGNAVDAAVAVGFALAVVAPDAGNLGGGGFLVLRDVDGTVETLDFRETAPAAASHDMYLDEEGDPTEESLVGHLASGVPGSVAGMWEMHRTHGALPWADVVAPAIDFARGHILDEARSERLASAVEKLRRFPTSRETFLVDGEAPLPGTEIERPDLVRTLTLVAEEGADAFYRGPIADLIVEEMERGGGLITAEDLAGYRPVWRSPIESRYRGHTVYSMPPPSSGGVTLAQILNILEGFDELPPASSAELMHLKVEAMRWAFIDRNRYLGDPDFVEMPLERLLSKEYAEKLRGRIDPDRATPTPPVSEILPETTDTTHYSIVDGEGRAVAITTTLNGLFGSGVTVAGAGFLLNNEMNDFAVAPGRPNLYGLVQGEANAIAPRKRMLSSMTPTIVVNPEGELEMVLGTRGGSRIITSVFHVLTNRIDHGMTWAEAIGMPRVHHQALPDHVLYEPAGLDPVQKRGLESLGHTLEEASGTFGDVNTVGRGADGGWVGIADPRRAGEAVGVPRPHRGR